MSSKQPNPPPPEGVRPDPPPGPPSLSSEGKAKQDKKWRWVKDTATNGYSELVNNETKKTILEIGTVYNHFFIWIEPEYADLIAKAPETAAEHDALKVELAQEREMHENAMTLTNAIACHSDMCEVCQTKAKEILAKAEELEGNNCG